MAERKAINKYYSPDYDPDKIQKIRKKLKKQQREKEQKQREGSSFPTDNISTASLVPLVESRLMLPFSLQCLSCNTFIYKGKKFNGKKEWTGLNYLEKIKIYRFTFKCIGCLNALSFLSDPQHFDYTMERGGKRLYDPWIEDRERDKQIQMDRGKEGSLLENKEKKGSTSLSVEQLEKKTERWKKEIETLEELERMKEQTTKHFALEDAFLFRKTTQNAKQDGEGVVDGAIKVEGDAPPPLETEEGKLKYSLWEKNKNILNNIHNNSNSNTKEDQEMTKEYLKKLEEFMDCEIHDKQEEDDEQEADDDEDDDNEDEDNSDDGHDNNNDEAPRETNGRPPSGSFTSSSFLTKSTFNFSGISVLKKRGNENMNRPKNQDGNVEPLTDSNPNDLSDEPQSKKLKYPEAADTAASQSGIVDSGANSSSSSSSILPSLISYDDDDED